MTIAGYRVNVGPNAARLADTSSTSGGAQVVLLNSDASFTAIIGEKTVTSATGFALKAGASVTVTLAGGDDIWAVTPGTTNTIVVHVFRAG